MLLHTAQHAPRSAVDSIARTRRDEAVCDAADDLMQMLHVALKSQRVCVSGNRITLKTNRPDARMCCEMLRLGWTRVNGTSADFLQACAHIGWWWHK